MEINVKKPDSKSSDRHSNENSSIYIHTNDPKVVNKGVNIDSLRHYEGGILPFINDVPYEKRKTSNNNVNYSYKCDHGSRPMHQTTFLVDQHPNYNSKNDYKTHNQKVYQGFQLSFDLATRSTAMNQLEHQFKFGVDNSLDHSTYYQHQFFKKDNDSDYKKDFKVYQKYNPQKFNERLKENKNNLLKNRKSNVDEVLHVNKNDPNYFTEYKRYHNYLGYLRGPGVSREFPDRQSFNVLTGKTLEKPSWSIKDDYKRVSGNVLLNSIRKESENILL